MISGIPHQYDNSVGAGTYQDLVYHYDQVGNVTAIVDNVFTGSRIFTYDALNRLETAYGYFGTNQDIKDCTYTYNSIGNITNKCGVAFTYGDSSHPSAVTAISSGKIYSYDANGNMSEGGGRRFDWDIDNRVISVTMGGTTTMEYDYTGMRVKKHGGGLTLYPFQGVEIDPDNVMTKFIRIGTENFASHKGTGDERYYYHNDHLGGVNVITDKTGGRVQLIEYDPWGSVSRNESSINVDPTHRFTGKELDPETGLYYYGGRYYDPEISRFISPDPFVTEPEDPQNLNRYSYVYNNPINYTDPSGYFRMSKSGGGSSIFGTIFGAIVGFFFGGPVGAVIGAGIGTGLAHISPTVLHAMEILGGIAMLLTGNPAGFFFVAQGGLGLCENTGCQISSAVMGLAGGLASFPAPSGAGASGISGAGSSGLGAAGIASGDISVGANSLSGALSLLGAGLTVRRVADDEGGGGPKWWWRLGRFVGPTMGFQSFPAFKRAFGPAGNDMEYHHIVLQTEQNIQRFGAWFIHNTRNIIPLPSRIHDRISAFYNSSIQPGGPLVREVVEQWDYIDQFNFGMEVVKRFGGAP